MCLTWRHDFGLPYDPDEAKAWGNTGPTPSEKNALRRRMRQLYEHHIKPLLEAYASRKGPRFKLGELLEGEQRQTEAWPDAHPPSADAEGLLRRQIEKVVAECEDALRGRPSHWTSDFDFGKLRTRLLAALAAQSPTPELDMEKYRRDVEAGLRKVFDEAIRSLKKPQP
jgi:hypothetical protein